MKRKSLCVLIVSAVLACSSSCGSSHSEPSADVYNRDVFAMDTFMSIKAYGEHAEAALSAAEQNILELEQELSVTDEKSDVWKIDHSSGKPVTVGEDTVKIISKALETGDVTGGALDITLYPVVAEWGFTADEFRIPSQEKLDELLENVNYSKVSIEGNEVTVPEGYQLDLGALAKGYTGDEIMARMRENGVESAIISLGGNVQALGRKPDGSMWKVAVVDPFAPDTNMCAVEIEDKAVITSGTYERYFVGDDGNRYWHIIDPSDGYPADNGLVSVTVIGSEGLTCDALSTALFVMGTDKAVSFCKSHPELDMILVTDGGSIYYTSGISESFVNLSSMPAEVIDVD